MYESVIFDFDGTLVDSDPVIDQLLAYFVQRYKTEHLDRAAFELLRTLPLREKILKSGLPLHKLPRLAREARQAYSNHIDLLVLMPGIEKVLRQLSEYPVRLFILSSNAADNIQQFLDMHQFNFFDDIDSAPNIMRKEKGISRLLRRHKIDPQRAIYIGDELRDIQACQKIPLDIAAVTWGHDSAELLISGKPTYVIDKPASLFSLLLNPDSYMLNLEG